MSAQSSPAPITRLSVMMFLQYAIWGAWLPLFFGFMTRVRGFTFPEVGTMFGIGAAGALLAPFVGGQIADRYLNTEKFLGISHIIGGLLVWQLASLESYAGLTAFCFIYSMVYAPTLALTNSLAFHHLPDRDRDFGKVRLFGTVGWICVGIGVGHWLKNMHTPEVGAAIPDGLAATLESMKVQLNGAKEWTAELIALPVVQETHGQISMTDLVQKIGIGDAFRVSGLLGILLGLFCFTLPATPPQKGKQKLAFVEALREIMASRQLRVLFLIALPMSCIHQLYFVRTADYLAHLKLEGSFFNTVFGAQGGGMMTIGQIGEIAVLALMPFVIKRFDKKWILLAGLVAFMLRFAIFAWVQDPWAAVPALALHGVCFGCFWFVAFLVVDEFTTKDVRASAQSLFNFVLIGIGIIVGNIVTGAVSGVAKDWAVETAGGAPEAEWMRFFGLATWGTIACLIAFLVFYPTTKKSKS